MIPEHRLDDDLASRLGVECVLCNQLTAFGHDEIGILHDLELLEAVVPVEAHELSTNAAARIANIQRYFIETGNVITAGLFSTKNRIAWAIAGRGQSP